MRTFSEAVERLEEHVLTGRDAELETFTRWLSEPRAAPELLNVTGPAGWARARCCARSSAPRGGRAARWSRWTVRRSPTTPVDKLEAAASAALRGNDQAEANILQAYANQLRAQTGKSVSADDAELLTTLSQAL